jgi:hypothetical protein
MEATPLPSIIGVDLGNEYYPPFADYFSYYYLHPLH